VSPEADTDGDRLGRTTDPHEAELEAIIEDLWWHFEELRGEYGLPSRRSIATKARLPKTTVSEWLDKRSVAPEEPKFIRLVRATTGNRLDGHRLELWKSRCHRARSAQEELLSLRAKRHRSGKVEPEPPPGEDPPRPEPPLPNGGREPDEATDVGGGGQINVGAATPSRTVSRMSTTRAFVTIWTRLGCSQNRRVAISAGTVALVVAVVVVLIIRPWESEPARLPLLRYQAPTPDQANFISPTEPGPPGWTAMGSLGEVYAPEENGVPGLVPIYRFRCTNCGEALVYFLSRDKSRPVRL
jgi:hypothetical protein